MRLPSCRTVFAALFTATCLAFVGPGVRAQAIAPPAPPQPAGHAQGGADYRHYLKPDHGWFWYEDPKDATPPERLPPKPPSSSAPPPPPVFSTKWLRENLDRFRDIAIDSPTKDNVELYLYLQKLAMDKAEVYALKSRQVTTMNPALDETSQTPTAGFSRMQMGAVRDNAQAEVLTDLAGRAVIWYFFRSDCPWCHKQTPLLQLLARLYNFQILPISIDHLPDTDGNWPDWVADAGQAQALGVTSTPTLYLVNPATKEVMLLGEGLRSLDDLQNRTIEIAHAQNWIDDDSYERSTRGLPYRFLTQALNNDGIENPDDPAQLLAALRAAGVHGVAETSTDQLQHAVQGGTTAVDLRATTPRAPDLPEGSLP